MAVPKRAALSLVVLLGTSIYGAGFWLLRDRGPGAEAVATAAQAARLEHRPGDLILLAPFYATRPLEHLGDLDVVAVRDPLAEDFDVHPRAIVLGMFGEGQKLGARLLAAGFEREKALEPAPGVTVDVYRTRATRSTAYRFLDHFREARVIHEKENGERVPCSSWSDANGQGGARFGRYACPYDADWFYVAPEWHRMDDVPRLCFWAHPPNQGRLVISFPDVPLTGQLAGRAGHTANGALHARAPVHLDVEIGPLSPQRYTFPLAERWRPFWLETPTTGTATVTFSVSTEDAGMNHFCFTAEMREPAR